MRLSELQEQVLNIETRYTGEGERLSAQVDNLVREIEGLRRRKELQQKAVSLAAEQLKKYERLKEQDVTSQLELDNARSNDINQRLSLEGMEQQIISREGILSETRFALKGLNVNKERDLSQLRVQISQLEESRVGLEASHAISCVARLAVL